MLAEAGFAPAMRGSARTGLGVTLHVLDYKCIITDHRGSAPAIVTHATNHPGITLAQPGVDSCTIEDRIGNLSCYRRHNSEHLMAPVCIDDSGGCTCGDTAAMIHACRLFPGCILPKHAGYVHYPY
jgi:hypothetical protein